jgi:hypothetical protein
MLGVLLFFVLGEEIIKRASRECPHLGRVAAPLSTKSGCRRVGSSSDAHQNGSIETETISSIVFVNL